MSNEINLDAVDEIVAACGRKPAAVIPILQAIQKRFRYLPEPALRRVSEISDIRAGDLQSVATFFPQFRTRPAGKHAVCVCDGTACHLKGAPAVFDAIVGELGIKPGEDTDDDGLFTVEKVRCLGCCTLAPAVQIDAITYGHVTRSSAPDMLAEFLKQVKEGTAPAPAAPVKDVEAEIRIGLGSCCVAGGSERIRAALDDVVGRYDLDVRVKHTSCVGMCHQTPMIEIVKPGRPPRIFAKVNPEDVSHIVLDAFPPRARSRRARAFASRWLERLYSDNVVASPDSCALDANSLPVAEFLSGQRRIATEHCGEIDPTDLDEYVRLDGFRALEQCLKLAPEDIIDTIERSGLRGRGGAGFPAARKWLEVRNAPGDLKYVICNGDEGDPGAFMDRMTLESYPYRVIEGMLIAAAATGASKGIFYIRSEYPLAVERMREALAKCDDARCITPGFTIEVREGAGAFVCGEESSLIASLEGVRPTPRLRPPYPAHKGLHGCPTLVNNVETLSFVPWIMRNGAEAFAKIGSDGSKGTKVFALAGKVMRGGLIEVPMGTTVRQVVEQIGGGVGEGRRLKAVQIGGPSGGCIPESLGDLPVDFESLTGAGAMMGSGGFVVLDDTDCIVDVSRYFLAFTQLESCGKCTPCRVGTKQMLEILGRLCEGGGKTEDIAELRRLSSSIKQNSLCGLGKTAPNPVLTALRYFGEEFEAHVAGKCPAGKCKALVKYSITADCIGCTKCAQECPAGAIEMRPYEVHEIDPAKCVRCGGCKDVCPVDCVEVN